MDYCSLILAALEMPSDKPFGDMFHTRYLIVNAMEVLRQA